MSVALPQIQKAFATNYDTITWVATGYFLAQAAVIPVTGYLSDRFGTKLIYLIALTLFTVGSTLCIIAPNEQLLIAFRIIQGIGGGALLPIVFAITFRLFSPTERGGVTAAIGVPIMLAPAFGPTIGGYLTTTFNWNAIFAINVPIGIVAIILAILVLKRSDQEEEPGSSTHPVPTRRGFDAAGLILSMIGFTALVYGINEAASRGWGDGLVLGFMLGGAAVLVVFVIVELLVKDPVLDVRIFRHYTFTASNILMWAISAVLFGSLFLLPFFFENVQGNTPLAAGEFLILQGLGTAVGMVVTGRFYNSVGPRIFAVVGLIILAIGTYGLTKLDVTTTGGSLQGWLILRGLGLGMANVPLQTLALSVVSNREMARASSLLSVTRMVFSAVGVAGLTTFLTQRALDHGKDVLASFQTQPLTGVAATCAASAGRNAKALQGCVTQHVTVMGLNDTFTLILIASIVCAILALFLGRDPAVQAAKEAATRGEKIEIEQPAMIAE